MVEPLLAQGARLEGPGRGGFLPLHQAARGGYRRIVEILLERGADPNGRALDSGQTALMLAANRGFADIVEALIAADADVNARAQDDWTALRAAEMIGAAGTLAILRAAGARE